MRDKENECSCLCHILPSSSNRKECNCCLVCIYCKEVLIIGNKIINIKPCLVDRLMPNITHRIQVKKYLADVFNIENIEDILK